MGYRSEVVLALDARVVPALMTMFAKCEETQKFCTQWVDNLNTDYDGEGNWMMRWDHIKWYDSFPEVSFLNRLIEALEEGDLSEFGLHVIEEHDQVGDYSDLFSFARIGEDNHDIDLRGYGFESIGIHRSINY